MKTLVVGASPNPSRYSFKATNALLEAGYEVELYGIKKGSIGDLEISKEFPKSGIDTVTMYVGPQNQPILYDQIIELKPRRVLFNPGTENPEFYKILENNGIATEEACTLVLLSLKEY